MLDCKWMAKIINFDNIHFFWRGGGGGGGGGGGRGLPLSSQLRQLHDSHIPCTKKGNDLSESSFDEQQYLWHNHYTDLSFLTY